MTEMPNAWERLKANSSLEAGTAWEHLNAQQGGIGPGGSLVLLDGLDVEVDDMDVYVEISSDAIEVFIDEDLIIEIENQEFDVEVTNG